VNESTDGIDLSLQTSAGGRDFYAQTSALSQHRWVKRWISAFNRQMAQPFAESQAID